MKGAGGGGFEVTALMTFGGGGVAICISGRGTKGGGGAVIFGGGRGGRGFGGGLRSSMILVSSGGLITSTTFRARPLTSA